MDKWKIPREKCVTPQGSLEFSLKYNFNRERKMGRVNDFLKRLMDP